MICGDGGGCCFVVSVVVVAGLNIVLLRKTEKKTHKIDIWAAQQANNLYKYNPVDSETTTRTVILISNGQRKE